MSITHIGHYIGGQVAAGASGRSPPVTPPAPGGVTDVGDAHGVLLVACACCS